MTVALRALLVEDVEDDAQLVLRALRRADYDVTSLRVDTADAMRQALHAQPWDLVLSDHAMPHFSGPAALELLKAAGLDIPFLVVSGKIGEENAVAMMRAGARDYIPKDNLRRLGAAVERELREAESRRQRRRAEEAEKALEAQYRQAQKMEGIGQLAGGVAHDFNNLLTIINGFSELLLKQVGPAEPARNFLEQIRRAGERATTLTRQLLIFSRKQVATPRVLDLNVVISEVQKMLCRIIGDNIKLTTELGPRLRPIKADPGQVEQVLVNLAVNARDAMPGGGTITIRTRNLTFQEGYSRPLPDMALGTYVLLEVSDTGVGMTPEVRARIFEPFFTTKPAGKGTGLGLATVFGIVKQSAGHIAVESQPGQGATFRIYLPESVEAAAAVGPQQPTDHEVGARDHEVVLLAEDDEGVRLLVNQALVRNGYTVLEASNGQQALQLAGQYRGPIHALVTDLVMPEMGGLELAQKLRQAHPETRVLCVSGYASDPGIHKLVLARELEFLPKPLSPASLTRKVRQLLDAARPAPQVPSGPLESSGAGAGT
jgi:two-component system cell cycle sensor histidine kinase/response regulator CckA